MEHDNGIRDYLRCNNCKHDGGQNAYGADCECCKWNPLFTDCFETNDPASEELFKTMEKVQGVK